MIHVHVLVSNFYIFLNLHLGEQEEESIRMGCVQRSLADGGTRRRSCIFFTMLGLVLVSLPVASSWSKEGHQLTCQIAQALLEPEAADAIENLLPEYVEGDLSVLCAWPDRIRHWHKYRWTRTLHFADTPDEACNFKYKRDCPDDMCVVGAISNFTAQLMHYSEGTSDRRYNLTEALLFLSHFMGDIHQPMHVGFKGDEGGNLIELRWFRRKSNLHHVWDRDIILTALKDFYGKNLDSFYEDLLTNVTAGVWSQEISTWAKHNDLFDRPTKYAEESIAISCQWGYNGVESGDTLSDEYFNSRLPILVKQIAKGGVRLAMFLNQVFGDHLQSIPPPT